MDHQNVPGNAVAEGRGRSTEGDGFAEGLRKLLQKQSAKYSFTRKRHHEQSQAADKRCEWRHDDMMILSEKWRETLRKACGRHTSRLKTLLKPCAHVTCLQAQATNKDEHGHSLIGLVYSRKSST